LRRRRDRLQLPGTWGPALPGDREQRLHGDPGRLLLPDPRCRARGAHPRPGVSVARSADRLQAEMTTAPVNVPHAPGYRRARVRVDTVWLNRKLLVGAGVLVAIALLAQIGPAFV